MEDFKHKVRETDTRTLKGRWEQLDGLKDITRYQQYAEWTLPHVCPPNATTNQELQLGADSTGARAVNHLANKLVLTLFRPNQPFFRLMVTNEELNTLKSLSAGGDDDAQTILEELDDNLVAKEKQAMQELDYNKYRTEATMAAKGLIITGNTLIYHPDGGKVQVYGIKDYCVVRDISGAIIEIMTKDVKAFKTFSQDVRDKLAASDKNYDDKTQDVTLITQIKLGDDKKFHVKQAADEVNLDTDASFSKDDMPWIALAWNMVRGEDYGRGLVEDYAGAFHALATLTNASVVLAALASDVKFLIDPSSVVDPAELNRSESGTYVLGREGDISTVQLDKISDIQIIDTYIQRYTQQISQAFLMNSSVTRDAERVTAEEIRFMAQELELSHGGIYSRFAEEWQVPTAKLILRRVGMNIGAGKDIYPQIITGLESLSRAGEMENLHLWIQDLAVLNGVPEEFRQALDPSSYAKFTASRRGVEYTSFLKSQADMLAEQEAALRQQQQAMTMQTQANVAEEAGKQAVQQE